MRILTFTRLCFVIFWSLVSMYANAQQTTTNYEIGVQAYKEGDFRRAFDAWSLGAYEENSEAQYNLGVLYLEGRGVARDPEQARAWFLRAAKKHQLEAQYNLGHMSLSGIGVKKDVVEALKWWKGASDGGYPQAQFNYGRALYLGIGNKQNIPEGIRLIRLAAAQKDQRAVEFLSESSEEIAKHEQKLMVSQAEADVNTTEPAAAPAPETTPVNNPEAKKVPTLANKKLPEQNERQKVEERQSGQQVVRKRDVINTKRQVLTEAESGKQAEAEQAVAKKPKNLVVALDAKDEQSAQDEIVVPAPKTVQKPKDQVIALEPEKVQAPKNQVIALEPEKVQKPKNQVVALEPEKVQAPKNQDIALEPEKVQTPKNQVIALEPENVQAPKNQVIALEPVAPKRPKKSAAPAEKRVIALDAPAPEIVSVPLNPPTPVSGENIIRPSKRTADEQQAEIDTQVQIVRDNSSVQRDYIVRTINNPVQVFAQPEFANVLDILLPQTLVKVIAKQADKLQIEIAPGLPAWVKRVEVQLQDGYASAIQNSVRLYTHPNGKVIGELGVEFKSLIIEQQRKWLKLRVPQTIYGWITASALADSGESAHELMLAWVRESHAVVAASKLPNRPAIPQATLVVSRSDTEPNTLTTSVEASLPSKRKAQEKVKQQKKVVAAPAKKAPTAKVKQAAKPTVASSTDLKINDNAWFFAQQEGAYAIHMFTALDQDKAMQVAQSDRFRENGHFFTTRIKGEDWSFLLLGPYPDEQSALTALSKIPNSKGARVRQISLIASNRCKKRDVLSEAQAQDLAALCP